MRSVGKLPPQGHCMSEKCIFVGLSLLDVGVVLFVVQHHPDKRAISSQAEAPWDAHLEEGRS